MPYQETAKALGISENGVKSAVLRLRRHLGKCLRAEIAETVAIEAEIDDEVRFLLQKVRT